MDQPDRAQQLAAAVARHRAGDLVAAERMYRRLLDADASDADAMHLLGVVTQQRGDAARAADLIGAAIAQRPTDARFHNNLGEALRALRRPDDALAAYDRAIALRPDYAEAWNNRALAMLDLGRLADAADAARRAVTVRPDYAKAWNNLGIIYAAQPAGDLPTSPASAHDVAAGAAASATPGGDVTPFEAARAAYETALRVRPDYPEAHANLATLLAAHGLFGAAEAHYQAAIRANPHYANAYNGLGALLGRQGRLTEAISAMRRGVELRPDPGHHSNLLVYLQYAPHISPREVREAHQTWAGLYAAPLMPDPPSTGAAAAAPHANDRHAHRRLRVGYVSPDLRSHPVSFFLEPILAHHDRARGGATRPAGGGGVEVFCYSSVREPDGVTERLRGYADVWRDVRRLDDAELARTIRADAIDVLVDLSVHLAHHRLLTFARKPAPVQMTYLGYPGTTGLTSVDYKLSDAYLDPPDADEPHDVERILRLPHSYFCYRPDPHSPDVAPPPVAQGAGQVTFASVNTLLKISEAVIETWAQILSRVPGSRLVLQAGGLDDPSMRQRLAAQFARHGVAADRLEMLGFTPFAAFLDLFGRLDVALDAFPYSSGTTTCHTLWMGVPVVTLVGRTAVQRMGLSVVANAGLAGELAAETRADYVEKAVALAGDVPRLASLRTTMRDRLRASPLLDGARQARDIEAAFRTAWRRWCTGETDEDQR